MILGSGKQEFERLDIGRRRHVAPVRDGRDRFAGAAQRSILRRTAWNVTVALGNRFDGRSVASSGVESTTRRALAIRTGDGRRQGNRSTLCGRPPKGTVTFVATRTALLQPGGGSVRVVPTARANRFAPKRALEQNVGTFRVGEEQT